VLDSGTVLYDAVLVSVGDRLEYGGRVEVVTEEAVSDRAYLDALVGMPVTLRHPPGLIGREVPQADARHVGTVIAADLVDGQVVITIAIHDVAALRAIRDGMDDISEGYRVPPNFLVDGEGGEKLQKRRIPNHVALEWDGRSPSAMVRIDASGGSMDPEQIKAQLDALTAERDTAQGKLDAMAAERDGYRQRLDAIKGALGLSDDRMDAAGVASAIASVIGLRERAAKRGLDVGAEYRLDALRRQVAASLGGVEARLDSADYCQAVIDLAEQTPAPSSGTRLDSGTTITSADYPI
jgi:hypothetical protein